MADQPKPGVARCTSPDYAGGVGLEKCGSGQFAKNMGWRLFSEVTAMEGDLRGADQEASQLLLQLP